MKTMNGRTAKNRHHDSPDEPYLLKEIIILQERVKALEASIASLAPNFNHLNSRLSHLDHAHDFAAKLHKEHMRLRNDLMPELLKQIVEFIEPRNYKEGRFCEKLAERLFAKPEYWWRWGSEDTTAVYQPGEALAIAKDELVAGQWLFWKCSDFEIDKKCYQDALSILAARVIEKHGIVRIQLEKIVCSEPCPACGIISNNPSR